MVVGQYINNIVDKLGYLVSPPSMKKFVKILPELEKGHERTQFIINESRQESLDTKCFIKKMDYNYKLIKHIYNILKDNTHSLC